MGRHIFLLLLINTLLICCSSEPNYTVQKLPSGKEIKILNIGKMHFTNDIPALVLRYQTDIIITDTDSLRKEAEEIWPVFRVNVEKSGLSNATIMPTTVPIRKYFIFTTNKSYYFTISRNSNGTWQHNKSWKRDYSKEAKTIAERYIESSIDQSIDNIVKTFNYPKKFTSEQLIKDVRALSKAVKIITYHLGNIVSYKINDSLLNYRYFVIQSATQEYWNKYPHFNTLI